MATASTSTTAAKKSTRAVSKDNTAALKKRVDELEKRCASLESKLKDAKSQPATSAVSGAVTWDDLKTVLGKSGNQYKDLRDTVKKLIRNGELS